MVPNLTFKIYSSVAGLPHEWERLAGKNIFLSPAYLAVLEKAAPANMNCHFIGLFNSGALSGIAIAQHINLSHVEPFVKNKSFYLKDYLLKKFSSHILIIGNNMLTGQNAYLLDKNITETNALILFRKALQQLQQEYRKKRIHINLLAIKDFNDAELPDFKAAGFTGYYRFCTQPNMIFSINPGWNSIDDYLPALNTKYRTQYNRARKKAEGIQKRKLAIDDIYMHRTRIHQLYLTVVQNAPFNTFNLPENHFEVFKELLEDKFLFYGYFLDDQLVGFSTLIKNGADMDTYFLGYDDKVQKEKMLYLNMLYDMGAYAIKKKFSHVIFARSAMEIKSSVGAKPENVYGIIKHTNPVINLFRERLFSYFDPKIEWKERNPFK